MALKIGRDLEASHLTKDPVNSAPNDDILASQDVNCVTFLRPPPPPVLKVPFAAAITQGGSLIR